MPADEYAAAAGGGALKLKGAKVTKNKKKKKMKSKAADGEKALAALNAAVDAEKAPGGDDAEKGDERTTGPEADEPGNPEDGGRFVLYKTEAEKRFEEAQNKRLEKLAQGKAGPIPNMLKSHRERVEELNSYLSKLSEHHDMPKIGPG